MKRIFFFALILLFATSAFSQIRIERDFMNNNANPAERNIWTTAVFFSTYDQDMTTDSCRVGGSMILRHFSNKGYNMRWTVFADYKLETPAGGVLLVKLGDGEVMKFSLVYSTKTYSNNNVYYGTQGDIYYIEINTNLTEEQVNKLATQGITKIRLSAVSPKISKSYIEWEYTTELSEILSTGVKEQYSLIKEKIDPSSIEKDF